MIGFVIIVLTALAQAPSAPDQTTNGGYLKATYLRLKGIVPPSSEPRTSPGVI